MESCGLVSRYCSPYKIKWSQWLPGPVLQAVNHLGCDLITWGHWFTFLSALSAQQKSSTTDADWEEMPWLLQTLRSNGKSKNPAICVWSCAENMASTNPALLTKRSLPKPLVWTRHVNNSELSKASLLEGWSGYRRINYVRPLDRDVKITSPTWPFPGTFPGLENSPGSPLPHHVVSVMAVYNANSLHLL